MRERLKLRIITLGSTVLGIREHSEIFFFIDSGGIKKELKLLLKASLKSDNKKKTPWLWSASELCRPSDRRFLAK
jgi:hypothetical protein